MGDKTGRRDRLLQDPDHGVVEACQVTLLRPDGGELTVDIGRSVNVTVQVVSGRDFERILYECREATPNPLPVRPSRVIRTQLRYPMLDGLVSNLSLNGIKISALFLGYPDDEPVTWKLLSHPLLGEEFFQIRAASNSLSSVICISDASFEQDIGAVKDYEATSEEPPWNPGILFEKALILERMRTANPFRGLGSWPTSEMQGLDKLTSWEQQRAHQKKINRLIANCLTERQLLTIQHMWLLRSQTVNIANKLDANFLGLMRQFCKSKEKLKFERNPIEGQTTEQMHPYLVSSGSTPISNLQYRFLCVITRLRYEDLKRQCGSKEAIDLMLEEILQREGPESSIDKEQTRKKIEEKIESGDIWVRLVRGLEEDGELCRQAFGFGVMILFDDRAKLESCEPIPDHEIRKVFNKLKTRIKSFEAVLATLENITLKLLGFDLHRHWGDTSCRLFDLSAPHIIFYRADDPKSSLAKFFLP
ncbi:hypothetical protein TWF173_002069 [Orbilia oligospora]|nr:hypothetical protein TWF173_002069 [Orbilia oligospora]